MYTKLICLFCFGLVLSVAGNVSADLVGYWKFDEGSGNVALDSSGYGNDGTIHGIPNWVAGQIGTALDFDGSTNFVEIPHSESLSMTEQITIEAWTNMRTGSSGTGFIVSKSSKSNFLNWTYFLREDNGWKILWFAGQTISYSDSPPAGEWHHIAATFDGIIYKCYIDGVLRDELEYAATIMKNELPVTIGDSFDGMIDEVKIYGHALSGDEIPKIPKIPKIIEHASSPDPADGVFNSGLWVGLSWRAGDFAGSHDVYMGENHDDVANGTGNTFRGNQNLDLDFYIAGIPGYAYPDGLVRGTTYYWRIDEVNDANPDSPWKGDVWSFTVPSKTACDPDPAEGLVGYWKFDEGYGNKAYDSSGYGNDGTIYGIPNWVAGQVGTALYFDGRTNSVEIPNSESLSMTEQITIEAWTNMRTGSRGTGFIVNKGMSYLLQEHNGSVITWFVAGVGGCRLDSPPAGEWHHIAATFDGSTVYKCYIDGELSGELNYFEDRTIQENEVSVKIGGEAGSGSFFDGMIDEVKIYDRALCGDDVITDMGGLRKASNPDPADGAFNSGLWVGLSWRAGDFTGSHDVYMGENHDDVSNGTGNTFRGNQNLDLDFYIAGIPGYAYPEGLVPGTTYYWRIDEVNDANPDSPWKGDVWSFTFLSKTACDPDPADGAEFVGPDAVLSWTPGYDAELHTVYIGNDFDDVNDTTGGVSQLRTTYTPGTLETGKVYYWRVDENDGFNIYKGDIWSFTTTDFTSVDDFEDYDIGNNEIWWAWKDGLGYVAHDNEPAYPGNGTGSAVGDETTLSYCEETIVHGGNQSMPYWYDNNKQGYSYYSEAELTLDYPRDWAEQGADNLIIWFRGILNNDAERLYVLLSNMTGAPVVVYHDDPAATQIGAWTEWVIPLQSFVDQGIDPTDVDKIAIGVGTKGNITIPGGVGKMFFDDARLYRSEVEAVE